MKTALAIVLLIATALAQHDMSHHDHSADVKQHGAEAMGFDQDRTTHHFVLTKAGGYVQATANSEKDTKSIAQVRTHLQEQQKKFAAGDFGAPEHTHGRVPPGVSTMQKLKAQMRYDYEPIDRGARLRITSLNSQAVSAIHDFLRFQISDHRTGDPTKVQ